MKTSTTQFKVIVDFMERYGDLSKSQNGLQGRLESIKKWQMLTNSLNKDPTGDRRSIEKWKKVWSDFKNNTKRKRTKILKYAGLPEHLRPKLALNDLENRVLNIVDQGAPPVDDKTGVGVEIQYMDTVPQEETTAPTVQFISTEQNSQTFHAESMSDGNNSDYFTSSDESSDRSSDESIETDEQRLSSPRSRHVNNHRPVFQRSRKSKGSPAGPSRVDPFEASDNRWRKLFSELTSEHIRLRKRELRQQERWHALFERCVDCMEKFINK
ncbi:uncharacterized protein LOC116765971 [Danaus plexippus]|uniref:Regulatory protein zeste n=1 Tax=Danaus plexippus plexippus TaxID=278856 RepID=A0A212EZN4_DANPL|nr:uncharacterized protein LOC116765971 [Danaus plexippus]OWR46950.1 hypothetical protein KGM_207952 [Danaus plexippus plexippus]